MPKSVTRYDLLISCPGDITTEIQLINQAVDDFNERFSDVLGISIRTRHWRKSSYAQSGNTPQKLLNKQFVEECDAAVAILWTRFGTPTDEYGSGTEEEIEIMLDAGKQVFMYFSEKPLSPSKQISEEYGRVREFRRRYKERGVYFEYSSDEDFSKLFAAHLTQYFLSLKTVAELNKRRASELILRGISLKKDLCDFAPAHQFVFNVDQNSESLQAEIRKLYQEIAKLHLSERISISANNSFTDYDSQIWNAVHQAVEVGEEKRKLIEDIARIEDIKLPKDFFILGNLSENVLQSNTFFSGKAYEGTENEKRKYNLINRLYNLIVKCSEWGPIEDAFSQIDCIELALENRGTEIDEDIEVTLRISKDILLTIEEFPKIGVASKKYLLDDCEMDALFSIIDTAKYKAYNDSVVHQPIVNNYNPDPLLGLYGRDYSEDYQDELKSIFCYSIYLEGEQYVLRLKFDYIKHHTAVAFPTPIFVKRAPNEIVYEITSKNSSDVIQGKLNVLCESNSND